MSRLISPVMIVVLVASSPVFGAGAAQAYVATTTELTIDGVSCGRLYSVEGGDPRARSVVVGNPAGTALPKKQIAGVTYAPITVEVALPPAPPILDWIRDVCANRQTRKTLLLTKYGLNGQVVGNALQAFNTLLTEVRFPAFDNASKDAARLTLVFSPEYTQAATTGAVTGTMAAKSSGVTLSNFRVQIGTLPASRVPRVESITIKQPVMDYIEGSTKQVVRTVGTTEFSNLVLTIDTIDSADWNAWRDDFVVKGNNQDASEKGGSLELLAADMKTTLLTLEFSHVGIVRASPVKETPTDAISRFQTELYCESIAISAAPAPSLTMLPVAPATATIGAPPPAASVPAALAPVTTMAPGSAQLATLMPATSAESSTVAAASGGSDKAGADTAGGAAQTGPQGTESSATAPSSGASDKAGADAASGGGAQTSPQGTESSATAPSSGASEKAGADAASGGGAASPAGAPSTATPAATVAASRASGLTPVAGGTPLTVATTASTAAVTTSADQGARDPKDFPRPDGSVRKSYSSVRQKTYTQEIAAYSAKSTPDALEEFYTKSLTAAGWELTKRIEDNNSIYNTHQIVLSWVNGLRSVTITLAEVKTGGVEIGVNLTTKVAP